jgi:nicotinamide riboside transporter PnuC
MIQPAPPSEVTLEQVHTAHRQTLLIVASIAFSLVFYALVVELLRRMQPDAAPVPGSDALRIVFFVLAGFVIFIASFSKSLMLRAVPAAPSARLTRLRTTAILTTAFAELPAVFGLAAYITTRRRGDFYILLVVAAYMIVRHFPQRAAWELYVRRGGDVR